MFLRNSANSLRSNTVKFARLILFNFYLKIWNVIHLLYIHSIICYVEVIMEKENMLSELKKYIQEEKFIKIVFSDKKKWKF